MTDQAEPTPGTPEELLDSAWERLRDESSRVAGGEEIRYVSRHQLAEFMTEAMLQAIGAAGLDQPATSNRPVPALLQSLKVMGEQSAAEGREGHAVICRRAATFVERVAKDVTRFLEYPANRVAHATEEGDLFVHSVTFHEDGRVLCQVTRTGQEGSPPLTFPLGELVPAGPGNDFVRIAVAGMSRAVVNDIVADLIAKGALHELPEVAGVEPVAYLRRNLDGTGSFHPCGKDDPGAFPVWKWASGGVITPTGRAVHHLQPHAEYVMSKDGPHAEPFKEGDRDDPAADHVDD